MAPCAHIVFYWLIGVFLFFATAGHAEQDWVVEIISIDPMANLNWELSRDPDDPDRAILEGVVTKRNWKVSISPQIEGESIFQTGTRGRFKYGFPVEEAFSQIDIAVIELKTKRRLRERIRINTDNWRNFDLPVYSGKVAKSNSQIRRTQFKPGFNAPSDWWQHFQVAPSYLFDSSGGNYLTIFGAWTPLLQQGQFRLTLGAGHLQTRQGASFIAIEAGGLAILPIGLIFNKEKEAPPIDIELGPSVSIWPGQGTYLTVSIGLGVGTTLFGLQPHAFFEKVCLRYAAIFTPVNSSGMVMLGVNFGI